MAVAPCEYGHKQARQPENSRILSFINVSEKYQVGIAEKLRKSTCFNSRNNDYVRVVVMYGIFSPLTGNSMETTTCFSCNNPLRGRTDKKFCNDYCRSIYHNARRNKANAHMKLINRQLLRNWCILAGLLQHKKECLIPAELPVMQGFLRQFHTETAINTEGIPYCFCYDIGFRFVPGQHIHIVQKKAKKWRFAHAQND